MYIAVLGTQRHISLAELEARFGAQNVLPADKAAVVNVDEIDINTLGGTQKIAVLLAEAPLDQSGLLAAMTQLLPQLGLKRHLGLSIYDQQTSTKTVHRLGLEIKKAAKPMGLKLRILPNKEPALSTAQLLHNRLTDSGNAELLAVRADGKYLLGKTIGVQDIDAYRRRDIERPARDARVGMLPPKLAQIMINLAFTPNTLAAKNGDTSKRPTVLDPFCGTGVVLQESLLMGLEAYGSDIAERMVRMSETNLVELARHYSIELSKRLHLEVADARSRRWQPPIDAVVSEAYLGPPLSQPPSAEKLAEIVGEVDQLIADTLKNLRRQLEKPARMVLALPCWQTPNASTHLPTLDRLEELGYNRVSFEHAGSPLIYARPGQIVAREITVLEPN